MEGIRITHADASHTSLLANLALDTFRESFEKVNNPHDFKTYTSQAFTEAQLEKEILESGSQYILAYSNTTLAGYARIRDSNEVNDKFPDQKTLELHRIYVLEKFIGQGIGLALMKYCLGLAKERGAEIIWLGVWEHNHRAQAFYKKFGFEHFGSHTFMMGNDAQTDLLMKLNLQ